MFETVDLRMIQGLVNNLGKIGDTHDHDILQTLQKYIDNQDCFLMTVETVELIQETLIKYQ